MIDPQTYYHCNLEGKSKDQILTKIRGLKQRIGQLKSRMEHPEYGKQLTTQPSEETQLQVTRAYLDRVKFAYKQAGGDYVISQAEKEFAKFNASLEELSQVTFTIGGYHQGHNVFTVELMDDLRVSCSHWDDSWSVTLVHPVTGHPLTKEGFLALLYELHIGEWKSHYSLMKYGYDILDGTQWELVMEYKDGRKQFRSGGSNAYSYNFATWEKIFGIHENSDVDVNY